MNLSDIGWNSFFEKEFALLGNPDLDVGRVAIENKERYIIYSRYGELAGEVTGKFLYSVRSAAELPKVGDWVVMTVFEDEKKTIIHNVLPRKTKFSRKVAGKKTDEQVIVANIDTVFIVQGLDGDYNLRRLERYLVMAAESEADPVIVLNKADLCENVDIRIDEVNKMIKDVPVLGVSAQTQEGINNLKQLIQKGKTVVFIGSSGVGKSTIINALAGKEIQKTFEVRESDSRGRHITSRRELIVLPDGGLLIDTPGMRELQLWSVKEGIQDTFSDIEQLVQECRFINCTHTNEKGCAVQEAVKSGTITEVRFNSYMKLKKELRYLKIRSDSQAFLEEKRRVKNLYRKWKKIQREKEIKKSDRGYK